MTDHGPVTTGIWARATALAALLAVAVVAALTLDLPSADAVRAALDDAGWLGWGGLVAGTSVALLGPVPRSAVCVLLGTVVGFGPGCLVAFASGWLAAVMAFGLSRWLGRAVVERFAGTRLARLDALLLARGVLSVAAARVVPALPFLVVNYAAGLTGVRFAPYACGTAVGRVPTTLLQVGLGASASAVVSGPGAVVAASLLAVVVVAAVGLWRRRVRLTPS